MSNPTSLKRLPLLFAFALLAACGARWQNLDPNDPYADPHLEGGVLFAHGSHGHRDFPRPFGKVWNATIEGLHANGLAVPDSARAAAKASGREVRVDLDSVWVHVLEQEPGRTCVIVGLVNVDSEFGQQKAKALLDEIQKRM